MTTTFVTMRLVCDVPYGGHFTPFSPVSSAASALVHDSDSVTLGRCGLDLDIAANGR